MLDWAGFVAGAISLLPNGPQRIAASKALHDGRLEDAATAVRDGMIKAKWQGLLRQQFEATSADMHPDSAEVLRAIWQASKGLVITTNYDGAMSWVRSVTGAQPMVYGLHAAPDLSSMLGASQASPVLWHLHGSIQYPDTIVLERSEYDRLYGAASQNHPQDASSDHPLRDHTLDAAYLCLQTLVSTQNLLFVGTSLTDHRVNNVLEGIDRLFPVARTRHFMVCLEAELETVRQRLRSNRLDDYITPLPVNSYERDLAEHLRSLSHDVEAVIELKLREPKWIRRRCRAVVAGGQAFIEEMTPLIGETTQHDAVLRLREILEERAGLTRFQRAVVQALRFEFDAKVDRMVRCTSNALEATGEMSDVERLNLLLLHALGLEKRNSPLDVTQAIAVLDEILDSPATPDELRLCAEFNRDVCREKLNDPNVSFARYIEDRSSRFSTTELLWPKGWNMELVRCGRKGLRFPFGELFENVISDELYEFSTGVGKSIANWAHYAGRDGIDAVLVERLNEIARSQTPANRVNFLIALASQTNDPRFRDAIDDALAQAGENPTVQRQFQTREVHGRYTLYGEFLMHGRAAGYVAPTPMSLRGSGGVTTHEGSWRAQSDDVSNLVARLGLSPMRAITGDLPFGQGFASSTVLALLHIGDQLSSVERRRIVNVLDWLSHGFPPSGLDHDSVAAQAPGFYRAQEWRIAPSVKFHGIFVRSTAPRDINLKEARRRIDRLAERLAPIAEKLTEAIKERCELDFDAFSGYCKELALSGVYTREQRIRFEEASGFGLSAKAIGGLHAKAMLVVGAPEPLSQYAASLPNGAILGRLLPK